MDSASSSPWRTSDLREWCFFLLAASKLSFIVLLDGLDEFQDYEGGDEGHSSLLDTIQSIDRSFEHVKLMCSARPDEPFKSALKADSSFRLQEINRLDIEKFAESRLGGTRAAHLVGDVSDRADGVFLWAHIVVNDLRQAITRNVTSRELEQRLAQCPRAMHDLFRYMTQRQDEFYLKYPKPLMRLAQLAHQRHSKLSLFDLLFLSRMMYSSRKALDTLKTTLTRDELAEMAEQASSFTSEVTCRGAGLLTITSLTGLLPYTFGDLHEINPDTSSSDTETDEIWSKLRDGLLFCGVGFIHRTALDFLNEDGHILLDAWKLSDVKGVLLLALANIAVSA